MQRVFIQSSILCWATLFSGAIHGMGSRTTSKLAQPLQRTAHRAITTYAPAQPPTKLQPAYTPRQWSQPTKRFVPTVSKEHWQEAFARSGEQEIINTQEQESRWAEIARTQARENVFKRYLAGQAQQKQDAQWLLKSAKDAELNRLTEAELEDYFTEFQIGIIDQVYARILFRNYEKMYGPESALKAVRKSRAQRRAATDRLAGWREWQRFMDDLAVKPEPEKGQTPQAPPSVNKSWLDRLKQLLWGTQSK